MKKKLIIIFGLVLAVFSITFFTCQNFFANAYAESANNKSLQSTNKDEAKNNVSNEVEDNIEDENTEIQDENSVNTKEIDSNTTTEEKTVTSKKEESVVPNPPAENAKKAEKSEVDIPENTTQTPPKVMENNTNQKEENTSNEETNIETKKEETTKTLVKTEDVKELELKSEKYGTKFYTERHYEVKIYSDGTTDKKLSYTITTVMDTSGFNGTAASMLEEAKALVAENMAKYNELLAIVNGFRAEKGASPLELDYDLTVAATIRAMEMAYTNDMDHTRPNGGSCFDIFTELGVAPKSIAGENIAAGYGSPTAVANGWKNSPGHYSNMINPNYTKIGLGMMKLSGTDYGTYWAQMFTS